MTDALTETPTPDERDLLGDREAVADATATIAPPADPGVRPSTEAPPGPEAPIDDDEARDGADRDERKRPDPAGGGSFGRHLIGPIRRLYDRVLLAPVE